MNSWRQREWWRIGAETQNLHPPNSRETSPTSQARVCGIYCDLRLCVHVPVLLPHHSLDLYPMVVFRLSKMPLVTPWLPLTKWIPHFGGSQFLICKRRHLEGSVGSVDFTIFENSPREHFTCRLYALLPSCKNLKILSGQFSVFHYLTMQEYIIER